MPQRQGHACLPQEYPNHLRFSVKLIFRSSCRQDSDGTKKSPFLPEGDENYLITGNVTGNATGEYPRFCVIAGVITAHRFLQ
jgi:hypothetical protein